ncbi:hypothetical protein D3C87_1476550 [compost metagenome]
MRSCSGTITTFGMVFCMTVNSSTMAIPTPALTSAHASWLQGTSAHMRHGRPACSNAPSTSMPKGMRVPTTIWGCGERSARLTDSRPASAWLLGMAATMRPTCRSWEVRKGWSACITTRPSSASPCSTSVIRLGKTEVFSRSSSSGCRAWKRATARGTRNWARLGMEARRSTPVPCSDSASARSLTRCIMR